MLPNVQRLQQPLRAHRSQKAAPGLGTSARTPSARRSPGGASTMRLCAAVLGLVGGGRAMDDNTIRAAVDLWESDKAAAEAQYGPISAWDTADVVDMKELFRYTEKNEFNENIGAWNTSSVTSMNRMFSYAHKFNQPIGVFAASFCAGTPSTRSTHAGAWDVRKVKDFECMFCYAEEFNQDIGGFCRVH